jgi:hypothetical protein
MTIAWPFDQAPNVFTITTRQVIEDGKPILNVVHYADDHSWAFTCGMTDRTEGGRVISMKTAIAIDPTLVEIADLQPGWMARRDAVGNVWHTFKQSDA